MERTIVKVDTSAKTITLGPTHPAGNCLVCGHIKPFQVWHTEFQAGVCGDCSGISSERGCSCISGVRVSLCTCGCGGRA